MSERELSLLSCSDSEEGSNSRQQQANSLDVADVPDRILEALHYVRQLQAEAKDEITPARALFLGRQIEALLNPVPAVLAAAAEQLAEVA